mmetsp:Transcript_35810/g.86442  ORF Transcript_35810/g.86442 Transcript_35810/m.86442 type:complete len:221 (+) Transcript_35810:2009-2671(+)
MHRRPRPIRQSSRRRNCLRKSFRWRRFRRQWCSRGSLWSRTTSRRRRTNSHHRRTSWYRRHMSWYRCRYRTTNSLRRTNWHRLRWSSRRRHSPLQPLPPRPRSLRLRRHTIRSCWLWNRSRRLLCRRLPFLDRFVPLLLLPLHRRSPRRYRRRNLRSRRRPPIRRPRFSTCPVRRPRRRRCPRPVGRRNPSREVFDRRCSIPDARPPLPPGVRPPIHVPP